MNTFLTRLAALALLASGSAAGQAHATSINLASLYGTANASSQVYGAASSAIDNNLDTTYSGGSMFQSGLQVNPNWSVDLGQDYGLTSVNIYQRTDELPRLLHDFTVTVFNAAGQVTFTSTYATSPGDTVTSPFAITFASVIQGKAVQISLNSPTADYLALAEVQVYGEVPEPASIGLLAVGIIGAAAGMRRRNRDTAAA